LWLLIYAIAITILIQKSNQISLFRGEGIDSLERLDGAGSSARLGEKKTNYRAKAAKLSFSKRLNSSRRLDVPASYRLLASKAHCRMKSASMAHLLW
jgi:hypothetical protein